MTLMEAVNRAGASWRRRSQRRVCHPRRPPHAHQSAGPDRTRQGPEPGPAEGGDIVRVTPRDDSKIFVMGEVTTPTVAVMRDGRMSLNEALGLAGGPSQLNSDPSQVFVAQHGGGKTAGLSPERGIAAGARWRRNSSCSPKTSYSWIRPAWCVGTVSSATCSPARKRCRPSIPSSSRLTNNAFGGAATAAAPSPGELHVVAHRVL